MTNRNVNRHPKERFLKRFLTIIMMLFLLGSYGLGVAEHAKVQISTLAAQTDADETAEGSAPIQPVSYFTHQSCLIQFAEEAGGLLSRRCRESVKRAASSRDVQVRMQWLLFFLFLAVAALLCCSAYFSLPGIYVLSSSIRIVSYLHDQDGLK